MSTLVLEQVGKRFGGVEAVASLSLAAPAGQITGLIGPNGAGKTTVVNLITGMLALTSGRIRFGEVDISHLPAQRVAQAGIVRTFQNIRLLGEASVLDNVIIGFHRLERTSALGSLLGLPGARRETRQLRQRALALLETFGLAPYAEQLAGSLSYGHQRRVEMARALAAEPRLLLLDEPVAGMNDVEAEELGETFRRLAEAGMGILLIEHNMRFVSRLCASVVVLAGGRQIAAGPPAEALRDPAVVTAYLGD